MVNLVDPGPDRQLGRREELGVHAANISDYPSQVLFAGSPVKMMFRKPIGQSLAQVSERTGFSRPGKGV